MLIRGSKAGTLSLWDAAKTHWASACRGTDETHWEASWGTSRIHWDSALWSRGAYCRMPGVLPVTLCCRSQQNIAYQNQEEPFLPACPQVPSTEETWHCTKKREPRPSFPKPKKEGWIWNWGAQAAKRINGEPLSAGCWWTATLSLNLLCSQTSFYARS